MAVTKVLHKVKDIFEGEMCKLSKELHENRILISNLYR